MRTLLDEGINVGLGTDVSGGYSVSMLVAAREACMVSRTLAALVAAEEVEEVVSVPREGEGERKVSVSDRIKLSVEEVLYLATRGGAACLGLSERVGAFEVGMEWDAQLVGVGVAADGDGDGLVDAGAGSAETPILGRDEGPVELWGEETWEEKIAKWVFCGDDRNTKMVFVKGRLVYERL